MPEILLALGALVLGVGLVIAGAEALVDGLLGVGQRLGIAPFVLTVVLSGFELENLAVGIAANAQGLPGAAAGTVLGGVTFLALGVSGLGALIAPMPARLPRAFLLWTAAAPLPLGLLSLDGSLSRLDGGILLVWFVVALVGTARSGRNLLGEAPPKRQRFPFVRLLGGLAVLTGGGSLLADGLHRVVSGLGVSQVLLGNTALAASVEAEEVARVAVPARRGRPELALGSIAGTIVHFIAFNAGVIAIVKPLPLSAETTALHLPVAVMTPAVLCLVLGLRGRLGRAEGAGLLALYVAYVAVAIVLALD